MLRYKLRQAVTDKLTFFSALVACDSSMGISTPARNEFVTRQIPPTNRCRRRACPLRTYTTSITSQAIIKSGEGSFEGGYTVDGVVFFDTLAAMKTSFEEDKIKAELAMAKESTAKEEVI